MNVKKRSKKIDWIKGWCILAVMLNHLSGLTYKGNLVLFTAFAVPTMILIAGYTTGFSFSKECSYKKIIKRCIKIWVPYALSVILFIIRYYKNVDLFIFLNFLLTFSTSGSYYVCVYTELVVVSLFLYKLYKNLNFNQSIRLLIITGFAAVICDKYTSVGTLLLGASKILGGGICSFLV